MKKTTKKKSVRRVDSKKRRNDGILSPDELKKAVAEYKARREERLAAKADEDDTIVAEETTAAVVPTTETDEDEDVVVVLTDNPDKFEAQIEEQLQLVKDRRDRRDAAGDPETLPEAEGVIADQDKDLSTLFDIIDTLLAQIAFDGEPDSEGCCEVEPSEANEDEDEEAENGDEPTDEESVEDESTETAEDEDDTDVEDDDAPGTKAATTINADSIDRIIRERVKIAKAASALNMDGLESIKPMKAKKTIIKAVKPGVRLDGRSNAYINAMFDLVCQDIQKSSRKDTAYQRSQMFNKDSSRSKQNSNTTEAARQKMIRRMQKSK